MVIASHKIEILIDLNGHTLNSGLSIYLFNLKFFVLLFSLLVPLRYTNNGSQTCSYTGMYGIDTMHGQMIDIVFAFCCRSHGLDFQQQLEPNLLTIT
jgi:hypothetical protein